MSRTISKILLDLVLWTIPVPLAYWLRLENLQDYWENIFVCVAVGLPFKGFVLVFFGFHRRGWRNVSARDLIVLIQAVGVVCICLFAISFALQPILKIPRSIPVIESMLAIMSLGGARLVMRLYYESTAAAGADEPRRVVIVGAGETGIMIAREMQRRPESGMLPVAYVDDDRSKHRQILYDAPVLGTIEDLPRVVAEINADEILIAMPSAPGNVIRRIVELAQKTKLPFKTLPGLYEILTDKVFVSQLREVDVEDLLRREPVELDLDKIAGYLENKVVLVTGAGGSIGSEIVNQVARFKPERVIFLGRGENSLFSAEHKTRTAWPDLNYRVIVADIRNREKIFTILRTHRPDVIFHAAAHKHVPLMEINPDEAILNNVQGTLNLVEAALECDIGHFVNISTDKAVNPTSVMGASKRVAECVVMRASALTKTGQIFVSVRFGNVLGSRGSVIPLFREQIKKGGPLTVTHPDMKRYFMTIPEAAQLVLEAGGLNMNGTVFVLDMGEPVKIVDLATDMIKFSGYEPGEDIKIVFAGIRPGEKLFEEYLTAEEGTEATQFDKIYVARNSPIKGEFDSLLLDLLDESEKNNQEAIRRFLLKIVPSFSNASNKDEAGAAADKDGKERAGDE